MNSWVDLEPRVASERVTLRNSFPAGIHEHPLALLNAPVSGCSTMIPGAIKS